MKKLSEEFLSGAGGFSQSPLKYKQVVRNNNAAVYSRWQGEKIKDYETIVVTVIPKGKVVFNKETEEDEEHYPTSSSWGRLGWSFNNKDSALKKYDEIKGKKNKTVVSTPKQEKAFEIPNGKFTIKQFAEHNNTNYISASAFVKRECTDTGLIKFVKKEKVGNSRKPSAFYSKRT